MDWFTQGLIDRGIAPHIAQAFALNGMDESGLKTDINEIAPIVPGSRGGYGLMQWTGPRRRALEAFAAERGVPVSDPNLQLDFLVYELQGPEAAAWSKISAAQDTPTAAAAIVNSFLRPAEQHRARREREYLGGGGRNALADLPSYGAPQPGQNPLAMMAEPPKPELRLNALALDPAAFFNRNSMNFTPIA